LLQVALHFSDLIFIILFQVSWVLWYRIWHLYSVISFQKREWRESLSVEWITMLVYLFYPLQFSHPLQLPWKGHRCGLPDGKHPSLRSETNSYGNFKKTAYCNDDILVVLLSCSHSSLFVCVSTFHALRLYVDFFLIYG